MLLDKKIQITVFQITNTIFEPIGDLSQFTSIILPDTFNGYGNFELWAPIMDDNSELLKTFHSSSSPSGNINSLYISVCIFHNLLIILRMLFIIFVLFFRKIINCSVVFHIDMWFIIHPIHLLTDFRVTPFVFQSFSPHLPILRILYPRNQPDGSGLHAGALGTWLRRRQRSRLPLHVRSGELLATVSANKLFLSSKHKILFLQQNKYRGAQKHRASIAILKRKAQTSITHPSKNRGPEITYTIKKNEMTVQSTPIDEDRLLASLRL